jgi:hypothetical protein
VVLATVRTDVPETRPWRVALHDYIETLERATQTLVEVEA